MTNLNNKNNTKIAVNGHVKDVNSTNETDYIVYAERFEFYLLNQLREDGMNSEDNFSDGGSWARWYYLTLQTMLIGLAMHQSIPKVSTNIVR